MNPIKLSVIILINLFFLLKPVTISYGCGWFPDFDEYGYAFYNQEIAELKSLEPLYFTFDRLYSYDWDSEKGRHSDNIMEWQQHFGNKASYDEVNYMIYKTSIKDLESARDYILSGGMKKVGSSLERNRLLQVWKSERSTEALDYLIFAKKCEPNVTGYYDPWADEGPNWDYAEMKNLMNEGEDLYENCQSDYIKMRYAFQVVRLAHYSNRDQECVNLYSKLVKPLSVKSLMRYWAMGHKAGALRSLDELGESAYHYARVFANCPSKRVQCYDSFVLHSDEDFDYAMSLCQNDDERAALITLRAIQPEGLLLEEMKNIAQVAPSSEFLDLLLVREISKIDYRVMGEDFALNLPLSAFDNKKILAAPKLLSFIQNAPQAAKKRNPALWQLSEAYIHYLTLDLNQAEQKLAALSNIKLSKTQQTQVETFQLLIDLLQLEKLGNAEEDDLYGRYMELSKDLDYNDKDKLMKFLQHSFSQMYEYQGQKAQAWLCMNSISDLWYSPNEEMADAILNWLREEKALTEFGEYLKGKSGGEGAIIEVKGTALLDMGSLDDALAVFNELPANYSSRHFEIDGNPFSLDIRDCHDCGSSEASSKNWHKASLTQELIRLQKLADAGDHDAALKVGIALYNISFYGVSWMATSYYRSGGNWGKYGSNDLSENEDAMRYLSVAKQSSDAETAARATYMAAKCEQNAFYASDSYRSDYDYDADVYRNQYRSNFQELMDNYADTEYFQDVLDECGYFQYYYDVNR